MDGFFWTTRQREIQGRLIDTEDRVQVGAQMLERLVSKPDPSLRSYDSEEDRGVSPSEAIASP